MLAGRGRTIWHSAGQGLALLLLFVIGLVGCWKVDFVPKRKLSVLEDASVVRFSGGSQSPDFGAVLIEGDSLFVGARNIFYHLNAHTLTPVKNLTWEASDSAANTCLKGLQKTQVECQNYIRVMAKWTADEVLVCGTNARRPECRVYKSSPHYDQRKTWSGLAICPFGPDDGHSYTVVDKTVYSATYADMSSTDPVIYNGNLRTEQYNIRLFNEPQFVSTYEYEDKVYFFFREKSLEHSNCGKTVYSRVARVCKKDTGGRTILQSEFTSFLKTRLNCSIPGNIDFDFNEIVATSKIGRGNVGPTQHSKDAHDIIYGIFNTPENSVTSGAICAFRLRDVISSFKSKVMSQSNPGSFWKPRDSPFPDLDKCADDSKTVPDARVNFMRSYPLMEEPVPAYGGRPLHVQTDLDARMTKLTVDWQVPAGDGRYYDILYVGTDDGRVLKMFNKEPQLKGLSSATIIEDIKVASSPILDLTIQSEGQGRSRLIVTSKEQIVSLPLHRCDEVKTCAECVALQDPYCYWVPAQGCKYARSGYQSLITGKHPGCPALPVTKPTEPPKKKPDCDKKCTGSGCSNNVDNKIPNTGTNSGQTSNVGNVKNNTINNNVFAMGASTDRPQEGITLFMLLIAAGASFILGGGLFFILGYCIAYRKHKHNNSNIKYLDKLSDTSERNKRVNFSNYTPSPGPKTLNVLMNVPPKTSNKYTVPSPVPEHKVVLPPQTKVEHNGTAKVVGLDKGMLSPARKAYV